MRLKSNLAHYTTKKIVFKKDLQLCANWGVYPKLETTLWSQKT